LRRYWLYETHQRVAGWLAQVTSTSWDTRIPSTPSNEVITGDPAFLVTSGTNSNENNDPRCALDCTTGNCGYTWACADDNACGSVPPVNRRRQLRSAPKAFPSAPEFITHPAFENHVEDASVLTEADKERVLRELMHEHKPELAARNLKAATGIEDKWAAHVMEWMNGNHQDQCVPLHLPAGGDPTSPKVRTGKHARPLNLKLTLPLQGLAILVHGFSNCPDDIREWGETIAAEGFEVIIPLLPGHGAAWSEYEGTVTDDFSNLPAKSSDGLGAYQQFVELLAGFATDYDGEVMIGGMGLGASLAHMAANEDADLYGRVRASERTQRAQTRCGWGARERGQLLCPERSSQAQTRRRCCCPERAKARSSQAQTRRRCCSPERATTRKRKQDRAAAARRWRVAFAPPTRRTPAPPNPEFSLALASAVSPACSW
jgi:hypothetical protein